MTRSLRERLKFELADVRSDLQENVGSILPEELDYAPVPGMRTLRGMLQEIGATEASMIRFLTTGREQRFSALEEQIQGNTVTELLDQLDSIRSETLVYLDSLSDDQIVNPVTVPESWSYLGSTELPPEEVIRWIARHEYYHVGQIVSYRWAQGHDPYA